AFTSLVLALLSQPQPHRTSYKKKTPSEKEKTGLLVVRGMSKFDLYILRKDLIGSDLFDQFSENDVMMNDTIDKAAENIKKLYQTNKSFLNALDSLALEDNGLHHIQQVAHIYSTLKNNPLHPLYEHLDRIQTTLMYVCAENPTTREEMRSNLTQLAAEYLPRPKHTSTDSPSPNTYTDSASRKSCEELNSKASFENPTEEVEEAISRQFSLAMTIGNRVLDQHMK
ncbi:1793_t:CDS:2, partial [Paraglomus brasilianum]